MPGKRTPIVLGLTALALALGPAGSAGPDAAPGASAQAFAVEVAVPGEPERYAASVVAPPSQTKLADSYASTGVATGSIAVAAAVQSGTTATATASSDLSDVSLFGGEIVADAVSGRARAAAGTAGAAGDLSRAGVVNLVVLGRTIDPSPNLRVPLAGWGYLIVLAEGVDRGAPKGASGYRGFVTALDVHLDLDHGGLPAGTEILVGHAEASAMTAPPATTTTAGGGGREGGSIPQPQPTPSPTVPPPAQTPLEPKPKQQEKRPHRPPTVTPKLSAGRYVFPVYGPSSYVDTFGSGRSDISDGWHHGDDVFGRLGEPVLAAAAGTVYSVGWNRLGGNRLWLRDRQGNEFYYAHLSAFSTLAVDGAHVRAGDVLGFMGNTGDARTTPVHLHFEIHPVSLLYRGYDGAVDPTDYLHRWRKVASIELPPGGAWAPPVRGGHRLPEPGAVLLQVSDISRSPVLAATSR